MTSPHSIPGIRVHLFPATLPFMIAVTRSGDLITVTYKEGESPEFPGAGEPDESLSSLKIAPSVTINDTYGEGHPVSFDQLRVIYLQDDRKAFDTGSWLLEAGHAKVVGEKRGVIECFLVNRHLLTVQMEIAREESRGTD